MKKYQVKSMRNKEMGEDLGRI